MHNSKYEGSMNQKETRMENESRYVVWFEPNREFPVSLIGNKAMGVFKLMRLAHLGFNVPEGFVITTSTYKEILKLEAHTIDELLRGKSRGLGKTATRIQELLLQKIEPYGFMTEIITPPYRKLCQLFGVENLGVAVRSSAIYEDLRTKSYAGSYESYLNIKGINSLVVHTLRCFLSAWKKHLLGGRKTAMDESGIIALLIQKIIWSDVAGVTFTADPVSGDTSKICINSAWGLGDAIVSGRVNADVFCFDKRTMQLKQERIGEKNVASRCQSTEGTHLEPVPPEMTYVPSLTLENAMRLATVCLKVEKELGYPVDIEWAFSKNELYLLQVRPITTL
jgi:pyruvate,water dikinase